MMRPGSASARTWPWSALLLGLVAAILLTTAPTGAQSGARRGWLHAIWDAEPDSGYPEGIRFVLIAADGTAVELEADGVRTIDDLLAHDRRFVEVEVAALGAAPRPGKGGPDRLRVRSVRSLDPRDGNPPAPSSPSPSAGGPNELTPFITLLCQFADNATPPFLPEVSERVVGPAYPGMGHYYAELSWNPAIMSGNRVAGWFRMPHPRRRYIEGTDVDYGALVHDCTGAAADKVRLPDYFGINLQFSGALSVRQTPPYDTLSFGGSWTLVTDGQARQYGVTWISRGHATNYVVYAHEMGHALGWPHSSMRRDQEYDSPWDVMSVGYLNFTREFGWLSIHTIAPHKDARGWIPASRHWLPVAGAEEEGVLVRTALPPASGYLAARLPLDPNTFYTVESRRLAGYDTPLPAEAVVIHQVVNGRAYAVEIGGDPQPNGLGAALRPGMTFTDSVHGISVEGLSEAEEGFRLRIRRGWLLGLTVGGAGRVVDASRAIDCEAECRQVYGERGAMVTLRAEPAAGSSLLGWGGACSGTGECQLAMHGDRLVTALFDDGTTLIPSDSLRPPAVMGAPYQDRLDLSGGAGSWVWSIVAGALPPGIELEADSGELHGIPEASGVFHFTAAAHSASGAALRPLAIQVSQPSLSLDEVLDQLLGAGKLTADELRFLDLQGNRNGRFDLGDVRAWLANRDATTLEPGGDR